MPNWTRYIVQLLILLLSFEALGQDLLPARRNKQWGYIDTSGNWVVQPIFDLAAPVDNKEYTRVFANGRIGLVSKTGRVVFKDDFKKIALLNDSILAFCNGNTWGLSELGGKMLLNEEYDYFYNFGSTGLIGVQKGKLHGLCNQKGEFILPVIYESVALLNGDLRAILTQLNGQFGVFSQQGERLLSNKYQQIFEADSNFFVIGENKLIGAIDSKENTVVAIQYTSYRKLEHSFSLWETKKERYLYNNRLNAIIHKDAEEYYVYNPTRIRIKKDEKYGVISEDGSNILSLNYQSIGTDGTYFKLMNNNLYGLSNYKGEIIIPLAYNYVSYPQDSLVPVSSQNKWGLYFVNNGKILDTIYDRLNILERQLKAGNKKGVAIIDIGENGSILSKDVYEQVFLFKIAGNAKYGFSSDTIKRNTNQSLPSFYFQDKKTGLWGLRNPKGELVVNAIFVRVSHFSTGFTIGYINNGTGRAMSTGQIQLGIANYMALIDDVNYKMMTLPGLVFVDENDLRDSSKKIVRIMASSNRFSTINKQSYKIKQYNAVWMDPLNEEGYTRIYVGGVLNNSTKEEPFSIGTVFSLSRNYEMVVPTSKMNRLNLKSNVVCRGGYWNYIDKNGNYLVNAKSLPENQRYKEAFPFIMNSAIVIVNNKWGVIDNNGKYLMHPSYDNITRIEGTDLLVLSRDEKAFGFTDQFGNIIGQVAYDNVKDFSDGKAWVRIDEKWFLLSEDGTLAENAEMVRFKPYKNGWAPIRTSDRNWAYWNGGETTWKIGRLQGLGPMNQGIAKYKQYGRFGFVNDNGIKLMQPTYMAVGDFENGFTWVKNRKGKMAIINSKLKEITKFKYRKVYDYDEALQVIVKRNKYGLLDRKGNSILMCRFKEIGAIHEQRRLALNNRTLTILNEEGKVIKKMKNIKQANDYNEGLCLVKKGQRFGYLDLNGNWALKPVYKSATDFASGVALVGSTNSRSIINKFGDTITKNTIRASDAYTNGITIATNKNGYKQYLSDIYGNDDAKQQYLRIFPFKKNNIAIAYDTELANEIGLLHFSGIEVLPLVFNYISEPKENISRVLLDKKKSIINSNGQMILEPGYFHFENIEATQIVQINGFGTAYGYLRYDGTWLYKEN